MLDESDESDETLIYCFKKTEKTATCSPNVRREHLNYVQSVAITCAMLLVFQLNAQQAKPS